MAQLPPCAGWPGKSSPCCGSRTLSHAQLCVYVQSARFSSFDARCDASRGAGCMSRAACQRPERALSHAPAPRSHHQKLGDEPSALRWLSAAAERNDTGALAELAAVYEKGALGQAVDQVGMTRRWPALRQRLRKAPDSLHLCWRCRHNTNCLFPQSHWGWVHLLPAQGPPATGSHPTGPDANKPTRRRALPSSCCAAPSSGTRSASTPFLDALRGGECVAEKPARPWRNGQQVCMTSEHLGGNTCVRWLALARPLPDVMHRR